MSIAAFMVCRSQWQEVDDVLRQQRPSFGVRRCEDDLVRLSAEIGPLWQAHPGWGVRLIRRQLERESFAPLPSEVTIRHWQHHQRIASLQNLPDRMFDRFCGTS